VTGNRAMAAVAIALATAAPGISPACGVCIEDKVAATYDHAVVTHALDRKHVVVFAEVRGNGKTEEPVADARRAARALAGVDRDSVRVARSPATLSFALDRKVRSVAEAKAALEKSARGRFTLELLKVVE
jgi:hypothetical protein